MKNKILTLLLAIVSTGLMGLLMAAVMLWVIGC